MPSAMAEFNHLIRPKTQLTKIQMQNV